MTDENSAYRGLDREFSSPQATKHGAGEYVRGAVHSITVEGFFSLVKRGLCGTYHSVSRKPPQRYMYEFAFRYNHRKVDDGGRTEIAIQGAAGKRLTYRPCVNRA